MCARDTGVSFLVGLLLVGVVDSVGVVTFHLLDVSGGFSSLLF